MEASCEEETGSEETEKEEGEEMTEQIKPDFRQWAAIELFGHSRIAGWVTEASIGGAAFIRCDVPKADAPIDAPLTAEATMYTRYLGGAAIYAINPTTQAEAMRIVKMLHPPPPTPRVSTPHALNPVNDFEDNDYDED